MNAGRYLKIFISACVFIIDRVQDGLNLVRGRAPIKRSGVLLYHRVSREHVSRFAWQMRILIRLAQPIRADFIKSAPLTRHPVAVTFDDGYYETIENVLPIMEQLKIPFTIFVPTRFLGKMPDWKNMNRRYRYSERLVDIQTIKKLKDHKLITFGSHSVTHSDFCCLNSEQVQLELQQSKQTLETILDKPVELFSFPYGLVGNHSIQLFQESGFRCLFTTQNNQKINGDQQLLMDRVQVEPFDYSLEFRLKVLGCYRWLPAASRFKALILKNQV